MKQSIIIRADGNAKIGLGHLHRSLALAEVLAPFFEITFAVRNPLTGIQEIIKSMGIELMEIPNNLSGIQEADYLLSISNKFKIIVLDGYLFDTSYQQKIKSSQWKLVCIDDLCSFHFYADVIINHTGGVLQSMYSAEEYTAYYLGPKYSLVKSSFRKASKRNGISENRKNAAMICMGGADTSENHTIGVLRICEERLKNLDYFVVIGEAYPYRKELERFVSNSPLKINILSNLSAAEMLHCMMESKVAICPPSGMAYEYLSVGGELYLRQTAVNQNRMMDYLINDKLAFDFKQFKVDDSELIDQLKLNQKLLFDGDSDKRLLKIFESLIFDLKYSIRRASSRDDSMTLFRWVNDPSTRNNSINSAAIGWDSHIKWFEKKLQDTHSYIFILECNVDRMPIGQIRFDNCEDHYLIDYSIDISFRRQGLGYEIIRLGLAMFRKIEPFVSRIKAEVLEQNTPSKMILEMHSFDRTGMIERDGRVFIQYEKNIE